MTRSFDVFFDLRLNKQSEQSIRGDLRRHGVHYDVTVMTLIGSQISDAVQEFLPHCGPTVVQIQRVGVKIPAVRGALISFNIATNMALIIGCLRSNAG